MTSTGNSEKKRSNAASKKKTKKAGSKPKSSSSSEKLSTVLLVIACVLMLGNMYIAVSNVSKDAESRQSKSANDVGHQSMDRLKQDFASQPTQSKSNTPATTNGTSSVAAAAAAASNSFKDHDMSTDQIKIISEKFQCAKGVEAYTLPEHGCRANAGAFSLLCRFKDFRVDNSKMDCDKGGEPLNSVMGRSEIPEYPIYHQGAFTTKRTPAPMPLSSEYNKYKGSYYVAEVLKVFDYPQPEAKCAQRWPGTTLFLTRYEYVNLFHTTTDWWNTFFALPVDISEPMNVVFLDAHAQGILDPVWADVFGNYTFVKHLPPGGVCFDDAIMVPAGYDSPLFKFTGDMPCDVQKLTNAYSNFMLSRYGILDVPMKRGKVLIIDRVPFISHPRASHSNFKRVVSNLNSIQERLQGIPEVTSIDVVRMEKLTYREQLRAFRESEIVIGTHGAGFTNLLYMHNTANVIELSPSRSKFFIVLSTMKGINYKMVPFKQNRRDNKISEKAIELTAKAVLDIYATA